MSRLVYTDITKDGTLTEPNFKDTETLLSSTDMSILVAGGVSSIDHVTKLAQMGVEGAIIGTAIYTGEINLRDAIEQMEIQTSL